MTKGKTDENSKSIVKFDRQFLKYHRALSTLPPLSPFLSRDCIKIIAVYRPPDVSNIGQNYPK